VSAPGWKAAHSSLEAASLGHAEPTLPGASRSELIDASPSRGRDSSAELRTTPPEKYLKRIAVKTGDRIVLVSMSDVVWIQSHGNLVRLHLEGASYEHRTTIKHACTHLDPERFLRIHRNAIVNLDHVTEFDLPRCGNAFVRLRNGKALPISQSARQALRRGLLSQSYASAWIDDA